MRKGPPLSGTQTARGWRRPSTSSQTATLHHGHRGRDGAELDQALRDVAGVEAVAAAAGGGRVRRAGEADERKRQRGVAPAAVPAGRERGARGHVGG